jgi:hypothetical protein
MVGAAAASAALALSVVTPATAADDDDDHGSHDRHGFRTSQPSMLSPVRPGVTVEPLLTVGDQLASGYRFESIPDGISLLRRKHHGLVDVYVNHETSKVPFPYATAAPTADTGESDFDNAQVSHLVLRKHDASTLSGEMVIDSSEGYQRFCSNYLATEREGFRRPILFTNEETPDYVYRQEDSWPPVPGSPDEEEAGVVVALDVRTGEHKPIYGMGRHNHENAVPVPGYGKPVVLSGDDTFTSGPLTVPGAASVPAQSQVYSYMAKSSQSLMKDRGRLWAFVSDTPGVNDYYDVLPGSGTNVQGHFIKVPKRIATGKNPDGTDITAADVGFPAPPNDGTWQTDLRKTTPTGIDGPQWALEYWSDINNVFQFVRIEDIAYDKRPGMHNVVYLADSGRGRRPDQIPLDTPNFASTNGRVWRMELDKHDPRKVTSLTVQVEGDDNPVKTPTEVHQPDNLESTPAGLLITEDPGSSQQFPANSTDPSATTARLWFAPFSGTPDVIAKVDQSADGGRTDVDGRTPGNWGAWESSGIVDASAAFGPGAFLINVQAHTLWVEKALGEDNNGDGQPDFTYKREGGQLALLRIPGL